MPYHKEELTIDTIINIETLNKMKELLADSDIPNNDIAPLLLELSEWKSGITKYLANHEKLEEWDCYKRVIPQVPDYLHLILFLECIYTQQDNITDEQYDYFLQLCKNEPDKSKAIRDYSMKLEDYRFPDDYITIYRGEHGLSDTKIGREHTASKCVERGISWTYEPSVAGFFAVRTQSDDCRVYTAKVHKKDVLLISDSRTEAEIVIKPIYLGTKLIDLKEEVIDCNISVMKKYYTYRDFENNKYDFDEETEDLKMRGTVKWFDAQKGYGFITDPEGKDVFVHHKQIKMEGYRLLHEDDIVSFELGESPKDSRIQAVNVEPVITIDMVKCALRKRGFDIVRYKEKGIFSGWYIVDGSELPVVDKEMTLLELAAFAGFSVEEEVA